VPRRLGTQTPRLRVVKRGHVITKKNEDQPGHVCILQLYNALSIIVPPRVGEARRASTREREWTTVGAG